MLRSAGWLIAPLLGSIALPLGAQAAPPRPVVVTAEPESVDKNIGAMMQAMFQAEPLTTEQRARLPQAEKLVARIMPPGTMSQVMGGMYDKMLGPMMAMAGAPGNSEIANELGVEPDAIELDKDEAARIAAIVDPAWKERREAEMAAVQRGMTGAMTAMEPAMRKGMAEAYAVQFTATELTDIDAFFTTPSGSAYARKSYALASDPRIIAASLESLPAMMAQIKVLEAEVKAASAKLPARRSYADLTPVQRDEIAKLTGLKPGAIKEGMERAAAERAAKNTPRDEE